VFDPGLWIEDQYLVLERHRGRRWILYVVQDRISETLFAVKAPAFVLSPDTAARFIRKAKNWINLGECEQLANAYLLKEFNSVPHLLVEYADGPSLADILSSHPGRALPIRQTVAFMRQLISGMKFLHKVSLPGESHGAIHGNLTPRNILTKAGNIKITDIGMADALRRPTITSADLLPGEALYTAPERLEKSAKASELTDVYSFGAVMYEVATGTVPKTCQSSSDPLCEIVSISIASPRMRNRSCPRWLEEMIMKCMAPEPEKRFQSFEQIDAFLREVVNTDELPPDDGAGKEPPKTSRVARIRGAAKKESRRLEHYYLGVEHLMLGLIEEEESVVVSCLGDAVSADQLQSEIISWLPKGEGPWYWEGIRKTPRYKKVMRIARKIKRGLEEDRMLPQHILLAILEEGRNIPARVLKNLKVDVKAASASLRRELRRNRPAVFVKDADSPAAVCTCRVTCTTGIPGNIPYVGHDAELRMVESLLLDDKKSIMLIGEPGVGKTAFLRNLDCIISDTVTKTGAEYGGIHRLRNAALLATSEREDDVFSGLSNVLKSLVESKAVLVIEDLPVMLDPGIRVSPLDLSALLSNYVVSRGLLLVATATPAAYLACESGHRNLLDFLEVVRLPEPSEEELTQILSSAREVLESEYSVKVVDEALVAAAAFSRDIKDRAQPAKALELLELACASARRSSSKYSTGAILVNAKHLEDSCSEYFKIASTPSRESE
jgi:serine/threonine protein kinase